MLFWAVVLIAGFAVGIASFLAYRLMLK
jgi:hypothetical protein